MAARTRNRKRTAGEDPAPSENRRRARSSPAKSGPSTAELAAATGYGPDAVRRFLRAGWNGDPATLEAWRAEHLNRAGRRPLLPRAARVDGGGAGGGTHDELATQWRKAKTARELLELRARQGELISRAEIERTFVLRIAEVRAALLSMGRVLRGRIEMQPGDVCEREINRRARIILEAFARDLPLPEVGPAYASSTTGRRRPRPRRNG